MFSFQNYWGRTFPIITFSAAVSKDILCQRLSQFLLIQLKRNKEKIWQQNVSPNIKALRIESISFKLRGHTLQEVTSYSQDVSQKGRGGRGVRVPSAVSSVQLACAVPKSHRPGPSRSLPYRAVPSRSLPYTSAARELPHWPTGPACIICKHVPVFMCMWVLISIKLSFKFK